ncbi:MAG TPA: hypothetical protein VHB70_20795, partial [Parafilimonas sp.]|nr:hypothetical protein [Parafilimonas sp.]
MKKTLFALLYITTLCINIRAQQQTPFLQWQKTYGGNQQEYANSIEQTKDGGYIIAGNTYSKNNGDVTNNHGNSDYWIVKTDAFGNIQWQKSYGGSLNDVANSIQQTTDGGYIVAGYAASNNGDVIGNHGSADYWVLKLDASGNIQWQKSLGGSDFERANIIQQTVDGGYIVAGFSYSNNGDVTGNHGSADYWIVKLDSTGNIEWQKSLGGSAYEEPYLHSIQQTTDGG